MEKFFAQHLRLALLSYVGKLTLRKRFELLRMIVVPATNLNINPRADFFIDLRSIHPTNFGFGQSKSKESGFKGYISDNCS